MSSPFTECTAGVRLQVRVIPKAAQNAIGEVRNGALVVRITTAPEKGKANEAVIKLLAKSWAIAASSIKVITGSTSRDKVLLLQGLSLDQLPNLDKAQ